MAKVKLTNRQKLFIKYYQTTLNATQAAILAGYSAKNADKIGSALLGKSRVTKFIDREMAERAHKIGLDADEIVENLLAIATAKITDFYDFNGSSVDLKDSRSIDTKKLGAIAAISEVVTQAGGSVNVKLHAKKEAAEFLLKYFGKYTDKQKHEHDISERLEDLIAGSREDEGDDE